MGYDLFIETRIFERESGKPITIKDKQRDLDGEWIQIAYTCSLTNYPMTEALVEIINRYSDKKYDLKDDHDIFFPQNALRELCSCLLSHGCFSERDRFQYHDSKYNFWHEKNRTEANNVQYSEKSEDDYLEWDDKQSDEYSAIGMGIALHELICLLDSIHYDNELTPLKEGIVGITDGYGEYDFFERHIIDEYMEAFKADPQAFEWEFCLCSY